MNILLIFTKDGTNHTKDKEGRSITYFFIFGDIETLRSNI